jgi:hypothetical protein
MKKLSLILASLVLVAGVSFAHTVKAKQQAAPAAKPATAKTSTATAKKVPSTKNKAVPRANAPQKAAK